MTIRHLSVAYCLAAALAAGPLGADTITNEAVPAVMNTPGDTYLFTGQFTTSLTDVVIGNTQGPVTLAVEQGSKITLTGNPYIGKEAASDGNTVVITGAGTTFGGASLSYTYIGYSGSDNSFSVLDGAVATLGRLVTSYNNGSANNRVVVSGIGSEIKSSSPTLLGYLGSTSSLTISAGGLVTSGNRAYIGFKGLAGDASYGGHSVTVTGAGSAWTVADILAVGNGGDGNTLRVEAGGKVTSKGAYVGTGGGRNDAVTTGVYPTGNGNTATITGAGSLWENTVADFYIGKAGKDNALVISAGGQLTNVKNAIIGGNGTLSGGTATSPALNNSALVTGAGSIWNNAGSVLVGTVDGANSTLSVLDQALLAIGSLTAPDSQFSIADGSFVRIDSGYISWFGDRTSELAALISSGRFQLDGGSGWAVSTDLSLFHITYVEDEGAETGDLTGGLYDSLGGYTILAVVPEPATWSLLIAGLALAAFRFRPRLRAALSGERPPQLRPGRKTGAFTLVEMLAVVAVLAVLACLAFFGVKAAMQHAATAQSISNLHQFGLAYLAFAADNDGRLPPAACALSNPSRFGPYAYGKSWDYWLLPRLGYHAGEGFGNLTDSNCPRGQVEKLFLHAYDENASQKSRGFRRTYAANRYATPVVSMPAANWVLYQRIEHPSLLILLTERPFTAGRIGRASFAENSPGLQIAGTAAKPPINPGGRYNYLFADGHVETLALEQTYRPVDSYPAEGGPAPGAGVGANDLWRGIKGAGGKSEENKPKQCPCGCGMTI